jgi:DNA replication licensing factor MCM4
MLVKEVSKQLGEVSDQAISHDDLLDALRRLESDGIIQFNERSQSVHVRSGIVS